MTRGVISAILHRLRSLTLLTLGALVTFVVALVLLWKSGASVIQNLHTATIVDDVREECDQLTYRIDSLIELSRADKSRPQKTAALANATAPELATSCGLSLVEYSLATKSAKRTEGGDNRWRMVSVGSARSWGQFLITLRERRTKPVIESGVWSCRGVTSDDVRGDFVFVLNP